VKADVTFFPQAASTTADQDQIKADMKDRIKAFLHPTRGGTDGKGWQVGQPVVVSDLFQAITPPEDTAFISALTVKPDIPVYHFPPLNPAGTTTNWSTFERPFALSDYGASVRVADYELVCAAADTLSIVNSTVAQS
jgi:hypothetical protein